MLKMLLTASGGNTSAFSEKLSVFICVTTTCRSPPPIDLLLLSIISVEASPPPLTKLQIELFPEAKGMWVLEKAKVFEESCGESKGLKIQTMFGCLFLMGANALATILFLPQFFFPAFGGLLYGYDIGVTSCATISIESATLSGITWYDLSSVQIGLITSGSLYGALIGYVLAFNIADILGRRWELISFASIYLIGALVTALTPDLVVMVIGRVVFGIGIGLAMHAATMYIAETAPSQIRGRLVSLKEFFIVLEIVEGMRYE